jgi:hypothetical protein
VFKEILKIIPKLDDSALRTMEKALGGRFARVAKKFGKGLIGALTGGGLLGIGLSLVNKLLNPLKETQDAIDKTLKSADDLVTNAAQFGTTAGNLAKLQALGQSTGLTPENINMLISKFQTSVAESKANPNAIGANIVSQFTGEKDTAKAFFEFIQSLQKMDKNQQVLVQTQVFGEKQILKMADFLQSDFKELSKSFDKFDTDKLTKDINKAGALSDLTDKLSAIRGLEDLQKKSKLLNEGVVTSRDRQLRVELDKENQRIQSYQSLATISLASDKILGIVEKGFLSLTDLVTKVTGLNDTVRKLSGASIFRGIKGLFGGDNK